MTFGIPGMVIKVIANLLRMSGCKSVFLSLSICTGHDSQSIICFGRKKQLQQLFATENNRKGPVGPVLSVLRPFAKKNLTYKLSCSKKSLPVYHNYKVLWLKALKHILMIPFKC